MTYNVFSGTLNLTRSINQFCTWRPILCKIPWPLSSRATLVFLHGGVAETIDHKFPYLHHRNMCYCACKMWLSFINMWPWHLTLRTRRQHAVCLSLHVTQFHLSESFCFVAVVIHSTLPCDCVCVTSTDATLCLSKTFLRRLAIDLNGLLWHRVYQVIWPVLFCICCRCHLELASL